MHVHACARGDAPLAGGLDQLGLLAFGRCHGVDDALHAAHVALGLVHVLGAGLALDLGRHLLHQRAEAAQLLHLAQLGQEVVQVEARAFFQLLGQFLRRGMVHVGVGLFHQRHDVAHAQDAVRHPVGVEDVQAGELLANAHELDGLAGDGLDRQGRTAARVAVELGEHHARERQRVIEGLGRVDRILTLHGVHHEQRLDGVQGVVQQADLVHHRLVDAQPAGRVDDQHVVIVVPGPVHCGARDVGRLLVGLRREEVHAGLLGHGLELVDGGGAVHVAGNRQHLLLAVLAQPLGDLAHRGGLARALQASHQDDGGRLGGQIQLGGLATNQVHHGIVDDAHQRLAGGERLQHLLAQCLFLHLGNEVAHHGQGHIGLQQGDADFPQHFLGIGFGQASLTAHGLHNARKALGKAVEHERLGPKAVENVAGSAPGAGRCCATGARAG